MAEKETTLMDSKEFSKLLGKIDTNNPPQKDVMSLHRLMY